MSRVKPISINGAKAILELREDGVIHLIWEPRASLGVDDIRAAMARVNDICNGSPHPLLVEMTEINTVSHDARAAFSTPTAASRIALLGSSPVDRVIANFRGADTYPCPTRFFSDRAEARNWLLQDPNS
ncbi:STAS/SEC14 domain-containing protein [Arthrobacter sp. B6]|uniref:STAS/SEC14 domain-containing protein n=1 Tax=Arthrobacter sp. B6 TaxID=1570137 RepID=UPI000831C6EF|nr:STAS/SEC14 domain-containing protein [Arthrobacter sp. B6]